MKVRILRVNTLVGKLYSIIVLVFALQIHAALPLDSSITAVINQFMLQQYPQARNEIEKLFKERPDDIDVFFMFLTAGQIEIIDYESYPVEGYRYVKTLDSVLTIINTKMKNCKMGDQTRCLFYTGMIHEMKSLVLAKVGDWMKAVKAARISVKLLNDAMDLDSLMYEPLYGIGLFDYYVGENLKWLPFMRDKSRWGIEQVRKVASSTSPLSFMAKNSLAWIFIEQREYKSADDVVSTVLTQYPDNTIFLRIKTRIVFNCNDYTSAIKLSKKLIDLSKSRNPVNWSDLVDSYQIIVASLDAQQRYTECMQVIEEILSMKIPAFTQKFEYIPRHLDYIRNKKIEIESNLAQQKCNPGGQD